MKTRRPVDLVMVVLVALCVLAPSTFAETLKEIFESALEQAIITPLPSAIEPLVTAAEAADTNEIALLEIAVANRQRRVELAYVSASRRQQAKFERQMKACAQIKSELIRIKNQRTGGAPKVREAREGGRWNLFHGRFHVSPAPDDWYEGNYETLLLRDGFGDIRGDDPPGPISAIVTLASTGYEAHSVPALGGELTVWGDEYDECVDCSLGITNFTYRMGSFKIAAGVWTGNNTGVLNPFGSRPVGNYNFRSEHFDIRFEGMFTNDLYSRSLPILFFASISGGSPGYYSGVYYDSEAMVVADVPMIVPLVRDVAELNLPKVMGAHVLEFNARGGLTLLENTTLEPNADLAMVRYSDGSYAFNPAVDEAVGALVMVEPFLYLGESPAGVFNFSDAAISIKKDRNTILTGFLRNPTLDTSSGGFFADLEITTASGSSTALIQIGRAGGRKMMQLAFGAAAYDLVELTKGFGVPGRMPWPEVFHLGAFNRTPLADAGPNQVVECACNSERDTKVTLDGTKSSDADEDMLSYSWTGPFVESPARGSTPTITLDDGCPGDYVITLVVNDGKVDSEPNDVVITVVDTTPPVITCPDDIYVSGFGGAEVTFNPTATDNCDPNVQVTTDIPSGSLFQTGVTTGTVTATDAYGNSSTCTFDVIVSCFAVNYLRIAKKGNYVEAIGTFKPAVPVDPALDDVTYIIDDGQGHTLTFNIQARAFKPEGKPEHLKFKYDSPKGILPDIKAKFDLLKCTFELKAKKLTSTSQFTAGPLTVELQAGLNLGQETVEVEAKHKHLEHRKKPKLDCCPR